ncbi:MAG: pentapeptide repeat-containing protein [Bacteroidota bacterium]
MESKHTEDNYEEIQRENRRLKAELQLLKGKKKAKSAVGKLARKITTNIFVGKGLKRSFIRLFDEIPEGNVSKVTLADVSSHLVWRLTRVGIFTLLLGFIPLCILGIQTYILNSQNQLLQYQNQRLDQQINLEEGNRRSSLIFLMSNIMDKIGDELKNPRNRDKTLSDALIGRIVSLSQALRPYRYLENDQLIAQPLSPERGQLLISLTNSNLNEATYEQIFERADFSYADLHNANFNETYIQGIQLSYANLRGASFKNADLEYANLEYADLRDAEFDKTYMNGIKLSYADLSYSHLHNVEMTYANLKRANFTKAEVSGDFRYSIFDGIDLDSVKIGFLDIEGIQIRDPEIIPLVDTNDIASIYDLPPTTREYLNENFRWEKRFVQNTDMTKSALFVLMRRKASNLSIMDNCLKSTLAIIKSSSEIRQLERDIMRKKEKLTFLVEANPFGDINLGIPVDSVYLYRMMEDEEDNETATTLGWVTFNPFKKTLTKFTLDDTTALSFNKSLLKTLPLECVN